MKTSNGPPEVTGPVLRGLLAICGRFEPEFRRLVQDSKGLGAPGWDADLVDEVHAMRRARTWLSRMTRHVAARDRARARRHKATPGQRAVARGPESFSEEVCRFVDRVFIEAAQKHGCCVVDLIRGARGGTKLSPARGEICQALRAGIVQRRTGDDGGEQVFALTEEADVRHTWFPLSWPNLAFLCGLNDHTGALRAAAKAECGTRNAE